MYKTIGLIQIVSIGLNFIFYLILILQCSIVFKTHITLKLQYIYNIIFLLGRHRSTFVHSPRRQTATALSQCHPWGQRTLHRDPSTNPIFFPGVAPLQLILPLSAGIGG